jgi:hypothetical protein
MACFRYRTVNTLHIGDNKDDDDNNKKKHSRKDWKSMALL